jgi:hypothetical protein
VGDKIRAVIHDNTKRRINREREREREIMEGGSVTYQVPEIKKKKVQIDLYLSTHQIPEKKVF